MRGGGIHATSSTISVYQPAILQIINNNAELGGGMYLEVNSKLYVLKDYHVNAEKAYLNFIDNHAKYGGAVYVDDTNSITCYAGSECFIQTLKLYIHRYLNISIVNFFFSGNTATMHKDLTCLEDYWTDVNRIYLLNFYTHIKYFGTVV